MACKNEHRLGDVHRRRITSLTDQQENIFAFFSMACNHCANPACLAVCPQQCFKKRRDGIVLHDSMNCIDCKSCIGACPFAAPQYNYETGKIDKCNFCVDRLDNDLEPACVSACISEALKVIDLSDPSSNQYSKVISGYKMARFTNPSVRFISPNQTECSWRQN